MSESQSSKTAYGCGRQHFLHVDRDPFLRTPGRHAGGVVKVLGLDSATRSMRSPSEIGTSRALESNRIPRLVLKISGGLRDAYYRYFAWKIVRKHITERRPKYADRRVLEQIIIPFILSRFRPRTLLEVGREPYEAFYNEFFAGRELWTVDRDAGKAPFGARNHVIGDAANLRLHFPRGYFDLVLMNGVFGWGLNDRGAIESAFAAVHAILAPGGLFVLGWNDTPDLVPVPLNQVESLKLFTPYLFPPLNATSFKCSTCEHTYNFYVR